MAPHRKLTVSKSVILNDGVVINDKKLQPSTLGKPEVYQQRKRMLLEYKDLFTALMRLPDKIIQKKLLDVINNYSVERKTVETQTDAFEFKVPAIQKYDEVNEDTSTNLTQSNLSENTSILKEIAKKRKRKRKVSLPQANKVSRTKHLLKINKPQTTNVNNISILENKFESRNINYPKRERFNSFCISECSFDLVNIYEDTETNHIKEIEQSGNTLENGLLPIQDAVVRNQINKLNMQIFIWQSYKGIDLNDILTEEDEDLLQLAILSTCDPSIISLLLEKGLNSNSLDADSNSVVHLAILNDITVASLDHLMKHVDLKLILTLNDDGYTPLHLAIRQDRYLLAECLINVIDKRLVKKIFFKRPVDELETDENLLKTQFKDYYEKVCLKIALDELTDSCVVNNHDLKQKLLQTGDRKGGNIALYFAINNRFEHLIYFLLAHLTDPRTENFSGVDCKTYFCEFRKSFNLSLKINNTMEKVIKLLS